MDKTTNPKVQTVVQGEASESEEEEEKEVQNTSAKRVPPFPVRVLQSKLSSPAQRARKVPEIQRYWSIIPGVDLASNYYYYYTAIEFIRAKFIKAVQNALLNGGNDENDCGL